jgi:putative DNA primase/helicase
MLGRCAGAAVRLARAAETLAVAEGIETALSILQATKVPTWAALSTSGLAALELPSIVETVIIVADGDPAGIAGAERAAARWHHEGRTVRIARPPTGRDANDLLRKSATA